MPGAARLAMDILYQFKMVVLGSTARWTGRCEHTIW